MYLFFIIFLLLWIGIFPFLLSFLLPTPTVGVGDEFPFIKVTSCFWSLRGASPEKHIVHRCKCCPPWSQLHRGCLTQQYVLLVYHEGHDPSAASHWWMITGCVWWAPGQAGGVAAGGWTLAFYTTCVIFSVWLYMGQKWQTLPPAM